VFLDPAAQDHVVELNAGILRDNSIHLSRDACILDYGCGSGRHTYNYRDAGYRNTFGYDVKNYLSLRAPDDIAFFRLDEQQGPVNSFPRMSAVPWPDDTFDFVFATSVFEHVMDQETAYQEVARVLKPGAWFLNIFPSKWCPIEPHMYVPFGGVTQLRSWFALWAALGIRNEFQRDMTPQAVADANHLFSRHGIKYPTGAQINRMLSNIFSVNLYVEKSFAHHSPGRSRHLAKFMAAFPPLALLFRFAHMRVILSQK
jgi:SAM-dependent methyltransferase